MKLLVDYLGEVLHFCLVALDGSISIDIFLHYIQILPTHISTKFPEK